MCFQMPAVFAFLLPWVISVPSISLSQTNLPNAIKKNKAYIKVVVNWRSTEYLSVFFLTDTEIAAKKLITRLLCAQMTLHKKSSFVVWLLIWSVKNQELQQWHISLLTWNHRRETWEFSWWLHNYHVTLLPAWALQVCYVCCKIYKEENGKILSAQKGQNPINWKENWQKN